MITAADLLRAIGWRQRADEVRLLDDLPPEDRARVECALAALPPGASVDLARLITEVRQGTAAERYAAQMTAIGRPMTAAEAEAELEAFARAADAHVAALDAECDRRGIDPRSIDPRQMAARYAASLELDDPAAQAGAQAPAQEQEQPDEPDPEPAPRRRIRRYRSQRAPSGFQQPLPAPEAKPEPMPQPKRRPLVVGSGDRPLGCPIDVTDYDAWRNPPKPPWLLDDTDRREAADPDEGDHHGCSPHPSG